MDATKSSPLSSFKSKKQLHSPARSDQKARKAPDPEPNPWGVKTPGKPADPPRRLRNRGAALSIKEIREASMKLRQRGSDPPAPIDPVVEPEVEHVAKPKKSAAEIKLPEKYQLLDKFFSSLDSSIRLLQLKRTATSFTNISPQIETLTDRRFTYNHLAQLKFIMPEVIELEKYLRHDERTGCMKPDLRITLNAEAIKNECKSKSLSGNLQMRKVFRARLLNFFKSHPEGDEVPEEALPEPFCRSKKNVISNLVQPSTSSLTSVTPDLASFESRPVALSQMAPSFKPRFAQRGSIHHIENSNLNQSVSLEDKSAESPSKKETDAKIVAKSCSKLSLNPSPVCILSSPPVTPVKCINSINDDDQSSIGPVSALMTPVCPATSTPSLRPTKRCYMSPDDNNSYRSPSKLVRRPPPNRPLKFDTPVKSRVKVDDDIFDILPDSLVQSIQEKERLAAIEMDPSISQAKYRRKMIAGLPKRFDMIYYLFQSIKRSVVTKEELIQKIIFGDLKVSDRGEVEEQLRLLQELVPEWIYEKLMPSGDILICVNKISSLEEIRTRLSEAKKLTRPRL
ncbi:cdt1-like protein a chloroplastic [Phtheirospermum japonicum]|uniref:Cdt1-like protein a chloroplastic n=1 Tax=Phtheirospermum japonicum TaxID=374723 RepID=A0A830C7Y3_9LAMI|nr:cdt1-like protein a chloroplastic [Phtheirospermum japonicum]